MADLVIDATKVAIVRADEADVLTLPCAGAIAGGEGVYTNADGMWDKADASAAGTLAGAAVAVRSTDHSGDTVTAVKRGLVAVGDALAGLAFGDPVYFSDTAGKLSDTAGTVSKVAGHVAPAFGDVSLGAAKLLFVDVRD